MMYENECMLSSACRQDLDVIISYIKTGRFTYKSVCMLVFVF